MPLEAETIRQHDNPHPYRIAELLAHTYASGVIIWTALTCLSLLVIGKISCLRPIWQDTTDHFFAEILIGTIAAGLVYCIWVEYKLSGRRRILLSALAFSGLALERIVHAWASVLPPDYEMLQHTVWLFYFGWQIVAGLVLVAAARNSSLDTRAEAAKIGFRTLFVPLVSSLFVGAFALEIITYLPQAYAPQVIPVWLRSLASPNLPAHCVIFVTYLVAFIMFARNCTRDEDRFNEGMTVCLLLLASSQAAALMRWSNYNFAYWLRYIYTLAALAVPLLRLGADLGKSHANARARIEHLEMAQYISSRLSNTLDLKVVLLTLVTDSAKLLSARFASIMLADECGEMLTTVATFGLIDMPSKPQKVEETGQHGFCTGHTARAFREKQVCVVDDVLTDAEFIPWRVLAKHDGYSVSIPLICQETVIGILNLFFEKHEPLNDERISLFRTLAESAAASICNAQLYERSLRYGEMLAEEACAPPTPRRRVA